MCPFCDDPQCIQPEKCTCYYPCANQFCPAQPTVDSEDSDPDDRPYFDEIPDDDGDYYEPFADNDED